MRPHPKRKRLVDEALLAEVRSRPCCICGFYGSDASHIKTRGSGGPDEHYNVVAHCRVHHSEWHALGWRRFCEKYPVMWTKLKMLGWTTTIEGRLWHPSLGGVGEPET